MKRITHYLIALAVMAFTFTSCEDVPAPFGDIVKPDSGDAVVVDPTGKGTEEDPFNVTAVRQFTEALADGDIKQNIYTKGYIIQIDDLDQGQYGNSTYWISDDKEGKSGKYEVYRGVGLGGQKFNEPGATLIAEGDLVVIKGNVKNYQGNTPEYDAGSIIVELNGVKASGSDPEPTVDPEPVAGDGDGSKEKPYNVTQAIAAGSGNGVYVKAFIVGSVSGQVLDTGAKFSAESDAATNILIAASASETNVEKCMPVQLPSGAVRTALNLVDNKGNYKKEVTLYGNIEKYFGAVGLKSVSFAILDGKEIGTNPDGGSQGGGDDGGIKKVSVAEFNAAAESTDVWYQLTGTISNLKDGDQYGNFDLTDESGSVYVYGVLSEKGGAKKLFQELVSKYGITNGSKITIIGNRGSHNGNIQVANAYFVSVENADSPATGADGSTIISVADFKAAAESTDVWYQLTGTISNLKEGDQYGNFDLTDESGSVYVYGVLSEKGGAKKLFQELVKKYGITNGKTITIVGNRGSYNGNIQVANAYFVSVK